MNENNKTLIKADIKYIPSKIRLIVYYVITLAIYCSGFLVNESFGRELEEGEYCIEWFYLPLKKHYYSNLNREWWTYDGYVEIAILALVLIAIIVIPFIIRAIHKRQCSITALTVTERGIVGSYNNHLNQVSVNMPIEHIDGMTVSQTLGDKLRSGKTLNVRSNSGNMKFHFVHNAEEVVNLTMDYINEIKYKR